MLKHNYYFFYSIILVFILSISPIAKTESNSIDDFQYLSPVPSAMLVSPNTNIIIRQGEAISKGQIISSSLIKVSGTLSGIHSGEIILSDDSKTLIFKPTRPFTRGEKVTIELKKGLKTIRGREIPELRFDFTITETTEETQLKYFQDYYRNLFSPKSSSTNPSGQKKSNRRHMAMNDSLPKDFPVITVNALNNPTPGYLFMGLYYIQPPDSFGPTYLAITDNHGIPIFYQRYDGVCTDFKVQPNGLLTFYQGEVFTGTAETNRFLEMNQNYVIADSFRCGNGYTTDLHELRLLPNGNSLLMSYDYQTIRMDTIVPGGDPNAVVTGLIIQELDASKNVIFQWRSWDHFQITDADSSVDLTASQIDYVHGNAIEVDYDNNLLISSRHLDEITKINRQTGDIIWRLGGENNQFTFVNDPRGFNHQHHIRRLDNGNYTLFDNGNLHLPPYSSALEYQINEPNKYISLVWSYRDTSIYGSFMGSVQRLSNSNTVIGWGGTYPSITEVSITGTKELELTLENNYINYRAYRFPWESNLLSTNSDSLYFEVHTQTSDTAYFNLQNNTNEAIKITTAVTRTQVFSIGESLPITIPANQSVPISVIFTPPSDGNFSDVLTLRVDKETEGFGRQVSLSGDYITDINNVDNMPHRFALRQNYPNPFNPSTLIEYEIPIHTQVTINIFDISGRRIKTLVNRKQIAGRYKIIWDGTNTQGNAVSSGLYIYEIKAKNYVKAKKMILLR